jgi:iron(III) transport system permease protein
MDVWSHLARYVMPQAAVNTIKLVIGVALFSSVIGTLLAWLTSMCEFPGRRFFEWALILPLALPTYVLAFIAAGFLDYAGPLQTWLRDLFGSSAWFPAIRSSAGTATFVLSLGLYPYVYLLARSAFLTQGSRAMEAAQTLGMSRTDAVRRVALPMARPWIVAGTALVCMETLADFGAVSALSYDTFTTAIYRAWSDMFSLHSALGLAGVLMLFVLAAFVLERHSRARLNFTSARDVTPSATRVALRGVRRWTAAAFAGSIFALAFMLPIAQLVSWVVQRGIQDLDSRYWGFLGRTLLLAGSAAIVIVIVGLALAYVSRRQPLRSTRALVRIATMGYAVPGTVLAVGILLPLVFLNNLLQDLLRSWWGNSAPVLLLHGTVFAVLIGYLARFLSVGFNPLDSGLQRVTHSIDEAAIGMGVTGMALLRKVHIPLLRTSLVTAAILVFVDVMKEMPIMLIFRPFGWDTLAVRVFEMTAEGEWERAALPALAIVLVGLIPAALLTRRGPHVA